MIINKLYTFTTIAPSILGAKLHNLKLTQILGLTDAIKIDTNLVNTNTLIYKSLQVTDIPSPSHMTFYVFKNSNGDDLVIAKDWIVAGSTIEDDVVTLFTIEFSNISHNDTILVQQRLRDLGYKNFTTKYI